MTIDLTGTWQFKAIDRYGRMPQSLRSTIHWMNARVPGTVHMDLLVNKKIPDPFYRMNENTVQWVDSLQWLYCREFIVPSAFLGEDKIELVADGLDTFADIRINGVRVGRTANMFINHRFNVRRLLQVGRNVIEILFDSPMVRSKMLEKKYGRLDVALEPHRVYVRKAQYSFGWDWGPKLTTSGIWRPIYLEALSAGTLRNPSVKVLSAKNTEAIIELWVEVERYRKTSLVLHLMIEGKNFAREFTLPVKDREVKRRIRIPHPQLWWPNGYGDQPLYKVVFSLFHKNEECCKLEVPFGIRTVRLRQDVDAEGRSFVIEVNGKRIFCKGADWIPADSFLTRVTEEKCSTLLRMAKDAHMNMLRVWGGGIYENDRFYEVCDQLGMMVWQDFMFACGEYPEEQWFLKEVRVEAQKVVKRLRNHPSIVLWCGNNECEWLFCRENLTKSPDDMKGSRIFRDILPQVCSELDGTRPYWRSSPFGRGFPNDESNGNHHQWSVWSQWKDYHEYEHNRARFVTEFGFQSLPHQKTVEAYTLPGDRHPQSEVVEHHNKQVEGMERLFRFQAAHYRLGKNLDEFTYASQRMQADALKCAVEHWRRRKFATAGVLFWQLNDCWPVSSWSVIDYKLRPKAGYYYAKKFYSPIMLSAKKNARGTQIWITNDEFRRIHGKLIVTLRSFRGKTIWKVRRAIEVPSNYSLKLLDVPKRIVERFDPSRIYLHMELWGNEVLLAENRLFFKEPKFLNLPNPSISSKIRLLEDGVVALSLQSDVLVRGLEVQIAGEEVVFDDNYLDLDPQQTKVIRGVCRLNIAQIRKKLRLRWG